MTVKTEKNTDCSTMRVRNGSIIHIFALLHIAVALACRLTGIRDEIWLTLLTVIMVSVICVRMKARLELIVAAIILTNVAGYGLGIYGAKLIALFSSSSLLTHSVSTFLTTEIIGWSTSLLLKASVRYVSANSADSIGLPPPGAFSGRHLILLACIILLIITLRIAINALFPRNLPYGFYDIARMLLSKPGAAVVMTGLLILTVRYVRQQKWQAPVKSAAAVAACLLLSCPAVLFARVSPALETWTETSRLAAAQIFIVSLTIMMISFSLVYVIDYAFGLRTAVVLERDKANHAEFQYERLKQQVNPHFLFNSLNILDCLVLDGKTAQASTYIHKLAGIYRYMLKYDDRTTVTLAEEMNFAGLYADLLKVRFDDGFRIVADIPESLMSGRVIPGSVQMLIENAIKHNRISEENPLEIDISADRESLTVKNEIRPRLSAAESTKVGLEYLKRQYMDLYGKEVKVLADENMFTVTVPLLHNIPYKTYNTEKRPIYECTDSGR